MFKEVKELVQINLVELARYLSRLECKSTTKNKTGNKGYPVTLKDFIALWAPQDPHDFYIWIIGI